MVGPVSNYVSGPQMVEPTYTDVKELPAFAKNYTAAKKVRELMYIGLWDFVCL